MNELSPRLEVLLQEGDDHFVTRLLGPQHRDAWRFDAEESWKLEFVAVVPGQSEQHRFLPPLREEWSNDKAECVGAKVKDHHGKKIFTPDEECHREGAGDQAS